MLADCPTSKLAISVVKILSGVGDGAGGVLLDAGVTEVWLEVAVCRTGEDGVTTWAGVLVATVVVVVSGEALGRG